MLFMLLYFTLALLLLVIVHESGHFFVARLCGVKVLRFSFGFGKKIISWYDSRGTEYTWSLIPLGGYVKMLDEAEGPVSEKDRHQAFNNKSVWARMAIVVAGPLFNFMFAFVALWLMLVIGIKSIAPVIDSVTPGSIAARAGLSGKQEIIALDGRPMASWREVIYAMALMSGQQKTVAMTVKSMTNGEKTTHVLSLSQGVLDETKPDPLAQLGLVAFVPTVPPIIGEVIPNSPAQTAQLRVHDEILTIEGHPIDRWANLVDWVRLHPEQDLSLELNRQGRPVHITLHTGGVMNNGHLDGFLGVKSQDPRQFFAPWLRVQREAPLPAIRTAFKETLDLTEATVTLVARLVLGQLPWHSISGPVGIAQGAGESAHRGLPDYLFFLALISVSLGVLNLLPIPMLDGGHLLYFLVELVVRRPVSDKVKVLGSYIGMGLLGMLMVVAMHNDMTRLVG